MTIEGNDTDEEVTYWKKWRRVWYRVYSVLLTSIYELLKPSVTLFWEEKYMCLMIYYSIEENDTEEGNLLKCVSKYWRKWEMTRSIKPEGRRYWRRLKCYVENYEDWCGSTDQ